MSRPTTTDCQITLQAIRGDRSLPIGGLSTGHALTLLFTTGVEEWRRRWQQTANGPPRQEAIIAASDETRGAGAATHVATDRQLAYTVFDRRVGIDPIIESIRRHVSTATADLCVFVDDVTPIVVDHGVEAGIEMLSALRDADRRGVGEVHLGCSFDTTCTAQLPTVVGEVTRVAGESSVIRNRIRRLRETDPTTFGYLRQHWQETHRGIQACDRHYPQSKQIHAALSDPATTPRTLGASLSGLVTLGVLDTWNETVGATRYDLTAYRPERMWEIGLVFAADSLNNSGCEA